MRLVHESCSILVIMVYYKGLLAFHARQNRHVHLSRMLKRILP